MDSCRLDSLYMARQKEFDPERALAKAMSLFWRMGYENSSLEALMKEMGIARQSLYDTFGDKRALYLKAMAHYRDQTNSQMQKMLNEIPSVRDGFASLLYGLAAETREQHERGCLLLSANLQRDPKDAVIRDFLRDNQARVRQESAGTGRPSRTRGIQFVENRQIEEIRRTQVPQVSIHANPDSAFTLWIFSTSSVYGRLARMKTSPVSPRREDRKIEKLTQRLQELRLKQAASKRTAF